MNVPQEFDWVTAICECSPAKVFERLRAQVEDDVKKREATLRDAQRMRYSFSFASNGGSFTAMVEGKNVHQSVIFTTTDSGILVRDEHDIVMLKAEVTVSNEGICKLRVEGQELDLWQVRKLALEDLFFHRYS